MEEQWHQGLEGMALERLLTLLATAVDDVSIQEDGSPAHVLLPLPEADRPPLSRAASWSPQPHTAAPALATGPASCHPSPQLSTMALTSTPGRLGASRLHPSSSLTPQLASPAQRRLLPSCLSLLPSPPAPTLWPSPGRPLRPLSSTISLGASGRQQPHLHSRAGSDNGARPIPV